MEHGTAPFARERKRPGGVLPIGSRKYLGVNEPAKRRLRVDLAQDTNALDENTPIEVFRKASWVRSWARRTVGGPGAWRRARASLGSRLRCSLIRAVTLGRPARHRELAISTALASRSLGPGGIAARPIKDYIRSPQTWES